ncbi:MAG: tetratricopeptide repeat protein [Muribaculaceae bacterium]|nr:tetratricopeptide repeat protein [Muribaculaceae bacterium]
MKKILALALLLASYLSALALSTGQQADSAYNKENYRLAIELYSRSIAADGHSATAWYNLGNAYFRNDNLGKAVLCYERALRLDPTDEDARQNLDFVRSRILDKPEDDTAFFASMHRSVVASCGADTWAWIAFATFVLLMGAAGLYIFSRSVAMRKAGFFGGIVLLCIFAYFLGVAYDAAATARSHDDAVVIVPSTQLSSTPRASHTASDKVVTIHEGTKVEIVDSVATPDDPVSPKWYNVKINNGTKAWLRASDVERI